MVKNVAIVACPHRSTSTVGEKNLVFTSAFVLGKTNAVSDTIISFEMRFICSLVKSGEERTTPAGLPPVTESVNALTFLTVTFKGLSPFKIPFPGGKTFFLEFFCQRHLFVT